MVRADRRCPAEPPADLLAIRPRAVVSTTAIVDAVWGDAPPDEPANAVQALVSRLRRAVPGIIDHQPCDRLRARRAAAVGRRRGVHRGLVDGRHAYRRPRPPWPRRSRCGAGEPLVDAGDAEFAQPIRARLEETRLAALQARIALDIEAGTADVAELEGLVSAYPLREALIVLLMRALDAAGDRSRALSVFDEARKRLADELGIAPNPALAAEHVRILRADEAPAV